MDDSGLQGHILRTHMPSLKAIYLFCTRDGSRGMDARVPAILEQPDEVLRSSAEVVLAQVSQNLDHRKYATSLSESSDTRPKGHCFTYFGVQVATVPFWIKRQQKWSRLKGSRWNSTMYLGLGLLRRFEPRGSKNSATMKLGLRNHIRGCS